MAGYPKAFIDVTTAYAAHLKVLRTANPGKDLTTLAVKEFPTIRTAASAGNKDDLNTAIAEFLLTND